MPEDAPGDTWVRGGGWQLPLFPNGEPPRALLDSLVPDRPAYLTSSDAHTAWVNTRALELAGITSATPDPPPDGIIVRMPDGSPQGTLRESAMGLVARHLEERTEAEVRAGLERGLARAASFGITTVHEASASAAFARAYAAAEREGWLTARALVALSVRPVGGTGQVAELVALRDETMGNLVRPVAAKIFLDGVIEGGTAALLEPYLDRPGWRGELNLPPDSLNSLVAALDEAGFKVHIHAIGDRAIRVALDAFEAQHERDGGAGPRHILAHIQLFDPVDIPRFAELGFVASFQPLWFYADSYIVDLTIPRLGEERSRWLYPARSLLETSAIIAAGSDWSVTSMDPLRAIEVAITRRDPDLDAGDPWIPEERVDLQAMLRAYTVNGAMAGDMEGETGTITVGKSADLVVLDTDLFQIPPERISDARVDLTVFEGRVVYRRD
jgi:predicted amidohydrolase YtcJ